MKYSQRYSTILEHIDRYWERLICHHAVDAQTRIGLPRRYVVSNTEMFKEMYYWDSFFIAAGLRHTVHKDLVVDIAENLIYMLRRFGRIPNASRFYMLSRSQPPFLSTLVLYAWELLSAREPRDKALTWLRYAYDAVEQEYRGVWRGTSFPDHREVRNNLSRYYDLNIWHNAAEAESGWDMTPRFDERCLDFVAIDLNSLIYKYEVDLARMADLLGLETSAVWRERAANRSRNISSLLWDPQTRYFFDYDLRHERRSTFLSIAGFFPMFAGLVDSGTAAEMVQHALPLFETEHGIVTTEKWLQKPDDFCKQWAWPNGWAPLTWVTVQGLCNYGFQAEALRIAAKWLALVNRIFEETGELYEKYDVVHGRRAVSDRYPDQAGFGWTNAVFIDFVQLLDRTDVQSP